MNPVEELTDLVWYYEQSASELGLRAAFDPASHDHGTTTVTQKWPTPEMCKSARRQSGIRDVLRQLTAQHQAAIEQAYTPTGRSVQDRSDYGAAAGLVTQAQRIAYEQRRQLNEAVEVTLRYEKRAVNGSADAAKQAVSVARKNLAAHREAEKLIPEQVVPVLVDAQNCFKALRRASKKTPRAVREERADAIVNAWLSDAP